MNKLALSIGVVVALLAPTVAFAAPPPPNVGFSFGFGSGPGMYGPGMYGPQHHHDDCQSSDHISANLEDAGYYHVRVVDESRREVTLDARRHGRSYELTVDRCSGDIIDRQQIN